MKNEILLGGIVRRSEHYALELQRPAFVSLVLQGNVGGMVGGYLFYVYVLLQNIDPYNFLAALWLPLILLMGALMGTVIGGLIWLAGDLLDQKLGLIARFIIGMTAVVLLGASLLRIFEGTVEWRALASYLAPGCFIAIPTAIITGLKNSPWRVVAYGTGARVRETEQYARLGGGLLRFSSLFGILQSFFILVCVFPPAWTGKATLSTAEMLGFLSPLLYFAVSTAVAFASPGRWITLTIGLLLNGPLLVWILTASSDPGFIPAVVLIYGFFWLVFITGRPASASKHVALTPHERNDSPRGSESTGKG